MNSLAQAQPALPLRLAGIHWVVGVDAHKPSFTNLLLHPGPGGGVQARGELANNPSGCARVWSELARSADGWESSGVFAVENAKGQGWV